MVPIDLLESSIESELKKIDPWMREIRRSWSKKGESDLNKFLLGALKYPEYSRKDLGLQIIYENPEMAPKFFKKIDPAGSAISMENMDNFIAFCENHPGETSLCREKLFEILEPLGDYLYFDEDAVSQYRYHLWNNTPLGQTANQTNANKYRNRIKREMENQEFIVDPSEDS